MLNCGRQVNASITSTPDGRTRTRRKHTAGGRAWRKGYDGYAFTAHPLQTGNNDFVVEVQSNMIVKVNVMSNVKVSSGNRETVDQLITVVLVDLSLKSSPSIIIID